MGMSDLTGQAVRGKLLPAMISNLEINRRRLLRSAPQSMFTKSGPGVRRNAKNWFQSLDAVDRQIVLRLGWVPLSWAGLPMIKPKTTNALKTEPEKKQSVLGRMWHGLKRLFGGS